MKRIGGILLTLCLIGCSTVARFNGVHLGMSRDEVIKIVGKPITISAKEGVECLNYQFIEYTGGFYVPYNVCIQDAKVVSFGRQGDFGTTSDLPLKK